MEPFLGQVILFAGNFAPRSWAFCQGQILPINQNQALFSILGTTYGGDGRTTFALPDLRGRTPIAAGNGAGLTDRRVGAKVGTQTNTISVAQMPNHTHAASIPISTSGAEESEGFLAAASIYAEEPTSGQSYPEVTTSSVGNGQPVNNLQPFLALNYIIALQGVFPSRS